MPKIYAYVKSESCIMIRALLPGEEVNGEPVSKHGDYDRWTYGKRETLAIAAGTHPVVCNLGAGRDLYMMRAARKVAEARGWALDEV